VTSSNQTTGQHPQAILKKETLFIIIIFAMVVTLVSELPDAVGKKVLRGDNITLLGTWNESRACAPSVNSRSHSTP
jgi:hypothetical protein